MATGKTFIGFLTTAAAGVVTGLLLAPKKGKDTRKDLKQAYDKATQNLEKQTKRWRKEGEKLQKDLQKQADSTVKDLQKKGKELQKDAKKQTQEFTKNLAK